LRRNSVSCPQIYASKDASAQLTNLVVNLQHGEVSSFSWDDNCHGCDSSSCLQSSKSLTHESFSEESKFFEGGTCSQASDTCSGNSLACDLKVFVTWAGTDKDGRNLISAGSRLSKLTGPTLSSLYNSMKTSYSKAVSS